jgi:quinoprotein glucose dehydrogenase
MISPRKSDVFRLCSLTAAVMAAFCLVVALAADDVKRYEPQVAPKSDEGVKAIAPMKVPAGFKVELFAAEPDVANPVCFAIDGRGRIYVAETFRQGDQGGVVDNRNHMYWLDDDLAAQTVEDRRAFMLKHHKEELAQWTKHHDRIRLLEDTDGDGSADKSTVFSTGYNDLVDGTGAGLLAWRGTIYYTDIPKLYALRDINNDGVADESKVLSEGYGVRIAFRGHDLHGLVMGPDGRIYFSIGDRGYHVVTKEGKTLADPGSGAVFRCEPDGSKLEVVHTGLRNPQELTFDDYGNLFTGDNNSDSGDQARWTYIVEGGHTGWNMAFQYLSDRGPWNREGWWHEWDASGKKQQAAFIVPPIKHIGSGPSGVTYYPGTGFDDSYRGTFFMSDFRGGANGSGIWSFKLKPRGAWFDVDGLKQFAWNTLVTDADFGPDGALYFSDWVNGWEGLGKGRIYRMTHTEGAKSEIVAQTKKLLAEGFKQRGEKELAELMGHPNRSVRQEAQFALVDKNSYDFLYEAVNQRSNPLARLHGIWGVGQLARVSKQGDAGGLLAGLAKFLNDDDAEVRAQVARIFADVPAGSLSGPLLQALPRLSERAAFFAAIALGKTASSDQKQATVEALLDLLRKNKDVDPYLRHAAVMGLTYLNDADALVAKMRDENRSARLGILLALRRLKDQRLTAYLTDTDPAIVTEAARAIHDVPIEEGMPQLAALIGFREMVRDDAMIRRSISANYRVAGRRQANVVAGFAQREDVAPAMRIEALNTLMAWAGKSTRDRVLGMHRPVLPRPAEEAMEPGSAAAIAILKSTTDWGVREAAVRFAEQYRVAAAAPMLTAFANNAKEPGPLRIAALRALGTMNDAKLTEAIAAALASTDADLRREARQLLSKLAPADAINILEAALDKGEIIEKQGAIANLAEMKQSGADTVLEKQLDQLLAGKLPAELSLDILEAAAARATPRMKLKLAAYEASMPKDDALQGKRHLLAGGSAALGKKVFWEKAAASCNRCHKVGNEGAGEAGPNLGEVGKQPREHLLESMLYPNRKIAKGFDTFDIETKEGDRIIGVLKEETGEALTIVTAENKRVIVKKGDIAERRKALSAMPDNVAKLLTEREVRDLVEYLAGLR